MLSDREISELSTLERAELARRLLASNAASSNQSGNRQRSLFLSLVATASLVLIPWIVFLAVTLPKSYVVHRWTAVWTGFDVALLLAIGAAVWAAWRRRQVLIVVSIVSATLLVCDAWFDVMTASTRTDEWISIASGLCVELPFAVVLLLVARRLLRLTLQRTRDQAGMTGPLPPLHKIGILGTDFLEMPTEP